MTRVRAFYHAHPFAFVLSLWALTRLWASLSGLGALPYPGGEHLFSDLKVYSDWLPVLQQGQFPVGDTMWQYPPLAGPAFMLGGWMAGFLGFPSAYWGMVALIVAFDAAILASLILHARSNGRWTGVLLWSAAGALIGPVMMGRFDVVPTLFAVLALLAVSSPARTGAAAAAGALLKVWPILTLAAVPRPQLLRTLVMTAAFGLMGLGAIGLMMDEPLSFLQEQGSRGIQVESVAALPYVLARAAGFDVEFIYRYGAMEVEAWGTGQAAAVVTVIGFAAIAVLGIWRLRGKLEQMQGVDVAFAVLLVAIATSRVNSPQYLVWLFGVGALCLADSRSRMHLPVVLIALSAPLTQLVYPWNYGGMLEGGPFPVMLQVTRILLLVIATWRAVHVLVVPEAKAPRISELVPLTTSDALGVRVPALKQG